MRRSAARVLPFAVTALLLGLLLRQIPPGDVWSRLIHAQAQWLLLGTGLYLGVNLLRALRYKLVLPSYIGSAVGLVPVSLAVAFLNNILPLRSGELSFVLLARARHDVSGAEATAGLAVARLFDIIAVAVLFVPLALAALPTLPPTTDWPVAGIPTAWLIGGAAAVVLSAALLALALAALGAGAVALFRRGLQRLGWGQRPWAVRALSFGERTVWALAGLRTRHTYGRVFALSLALWGVMFLWTYAFTRAVGVTTPLGPFVVGASFGVFAKSLPVPDVGGIGLAVSAWALGFTLLGWPKEEAIASGLAVAALGLAVSAGFGLAALTRLGRWPREAPVRAVID